MSKFKSMEKTRTLVIALVIGTVALFAVNMGSNALLKSWRLDLTEEKLFTISDGTRTILKGLKKPITVDLYFSKLLGERSPLHGFYFNRVKELLEQYESISGGKVKLNVLEPEPFTDTEDQAVAIGLQGIPVSEAGDHGYFGLFAKNETGNQEIFPFFNVEREAFIEYDMTKMIHTLANPKRKTIGLMSMLPVDGMGRDAKPWIVIQQIRDFFEVNDLGLDVKEIPADIETLMVIHPKVFSDTTLYAIDQFVLRGGRLLLFVDAHSEAAMVAGQQFGQAAMMMAEQSDVDPLFKAWGIRMVKDKFAADLDTARRVNAGGQEGTNRTVVSDYVAWLKLTEANMDRDDVVNVGIKTLNISTPAILEKIEGATTEMTPLLQTSPNSQATDVGRVKMRPDVLDLVRTFKPGGKPLTVAARLKGRVKTAFPDGRPKEEKKEEDKKDADKKAEAKDGDKKADEPKKPAKVYAPHLAESTRPLNIIIVGDSDILFDEFWVTVRKFFNQQVVVPQANNGDFVINILDDLTGSDSLVGLRARGRSERPFHLVEGLRKDAEHQFRATEEALLKKRNEVQIKLQELENKYKTLKADAKLSDEDKKTLEGYRLELVSIRKDLRKVQHELRKDIESLDSWLKFLNIGAMPIVLGVLTLILLAVRRRRVASRLLEG